MLAAAFADESVEAVGQPGERVQVGAAGAGVFEAEAVVVGELVVGAHDPGGDVPGGWDRWRCGWPGRTTVMNTATNSGRRPDGTAVPGWGNDLAGVRRFFWRQQCRALSSP